MSSAHSDSESDPIQLPLPSSPPVSETTNTCFLCKKSGVKNFNAETLSKAQMCLKIKQFYNLSGKMLCCQKIWRTNPSATVHGPVTKTL